MAKGFRPGMKERIDEERASISKEELERIKKQREFDSIKQGTYTYKIALFSDQLRQNMYKHKSVVENRLWNVHNLLNNITRLEEQLKSGNITEKLDNELVMNDIEVKTLIQKNKWLLEGEARAIPLELGLLRSVVGHLDVAKNVIMTEEEFETYAENVLKRLADAGYEPLA